MVQIDPTTDYQHVWQLFEWYVQQLTTAFEYGFERLGGSLRVHMRMAIVYASTPVGKIWRR